VGILRAIRREADEEQSFEAEISTEGTEVVDPLVISLEGTSEGQINSDVCSVPLE
jgi:hypothetical protein